MWTKLAFFEPKAKNTIPSFRTQWSMKLLLFLFAEALSLEPKHPPVLWWWWSYVCLNECLWMQMYDVMCRANECPNTRIRSHNHSLIPLGITKVSLPFIFRLHRLFFGVSALTFRCKLCIPLGTSFELLRLLFRRYRVDFSRFALYFGGISVDFSL